MGAVEVEVRGRAVGGRDDHDPAREELVEEPAQHHRICDVRHLQFGRIVASEIEYGIKWMSGRTTRR